MNFSFDQLPIEFFEKVRKERDGNTTKKGKAAKESGGRSVKEEQGSTGLMQLDQRFGC